MTGNHIPSVLVVFYTHINGYGIGTKFDGTAWLLVVFQSDITLFAYTETVEFINRLVDVVGAIAVILLCGALCLEFSLTA